MKNIKTLRINQCDIECTLTSLGLTNDIYQGQFHSKTAAIRVPKEKTKNLSSFNNESYALPLIQELQLDVPELYYDESTRVRITEWIPEAIEYKDCNALNKIERAAILIKKLHTASYITNNEFDCVALLHEYQSHVIHPLYPCDDFQVLENLVSSIHNPHILCHNDLVSGNLLFTNPRDYLIDYEYAKDNDPLFDIMSFFTENDITDESLRNRFYMIYFDEVLDDKTRYELSVYESFHNLLWCTWANMMYDLLQEDIYKEIAHNKYKALCLSFAKINGIEKNTTNEGASIGV